MVSLSRHATVNHSPVSFMSIGNLRFKNYFLTPCRWNKTHLQLLDNFHAPGTTLGADRDSLFLLPSRSLLSNSTQLSTDEVLSRVWLTSSYSVLGDADWTGFSLFYFFTSLFSCWASPIAQLVKNLPAMWEIWVRSLGWEDPLEKGKDTHSAILVWRIP